MPSLLWPASCNVVTQKYGNKSARYVKGYHTGIDIGCRAGTPVRASHDGKVTSARWNGAYGNQVKIAADGFETWYNHLSKFAVNKGDVVSAGRTIGYIGSTGQSTGPHLHFELRVDGKDIDPTPYLDGANVPSGATQVADLNPLDDIPGIREAKAVYDTIKATVGVFEWLTDTKNWFRIGLVFGGALLLLVTFVGVARTKAMGAVLGSTVKKFGKKVSGNGSNTAS